MESFGGEDSSPDATSGSNSEAWDKFYTKTTANHYKLRYNLRHFFHELLPPDVSPSYQPPAPLKSTSHSDPLVLFETGCGTGSTIIPLLRANPRLNAVAIDISPVAVKYLKQQPEYTPDRISAFVADLTRPFTYSDSSGLKNGVDFVSCVFTLSAIHPEDIDKAIIGIKSCMKEGAIVLIRDYAAGDMREMKLERKWGLVENTKRLCRRGDGTLARFWTVDEMKELWGSEDIECLECCVMERRIRNRKTDVDMGRKWIQAKFKKKNHKLDG